MTEIGSGAFRGCESLKSVTIPDSVTKIGLWAFYGCTSLKSVTIPDSVTEIGDSAFSHFSHCTSLKIIKLRPDDETIERNYADVENFEEEISKAFEMIRTEDYSAKVNTTVKYPFVMMKYMHDRS